MAGWFGPGGDCNCPCEGHECPPNCSDGVNLLTGWSITLDFPDEIILWAPFGSFEVQKYVCFGCSVFNGTYYASLKGSGINLAEICDFDLPQRTEAISYEKTTHFRTNCEDLSGPGRDPTPDVDNIELYQTFTRSGSTGPLGSITTWFRLNRGGSPGAAFQHSSPCTAAVLEDDTEILETAGCDPPSTILEIAYVPILH